MVGVCNGGACAGGVSNGGPSGITMEDEGVVDSGGGDRGTYGLNCILFRSQGRPLPSTLTLY